MGWHGAPFNGEEKRTPAAARALLSAAAAPPATVLRNTYMVGYEMLAVQRDLTAEQSGLNAWCAVSDIHFRELEYKTI